MSDRFVLHADKEEVEKLLDATTARDDYFDPNYNISPGTLHPILLSEEGERQIQQAHWGLIPEDAEEETEGREHYEIRTDQMEEVMDSGKWAAPGRCVIPANGFYKWKSSEKNATPFYIRLLSNRAMGLAGLYSVWKSPSGRDVYSFAMIQTEANALVQPVDDLMPVILRRESFDAWLNKKADAVKSLLQPFSLTEMAVNRVTEEVNDLSNNSPELIQPIPK